MGVGGRVDPGRQGELVGQPHNRRRHQHGIRPALELKSLPHPARGVSGIALQRTVHPARSEVPGVVVARPPTDQPGRRRGAFGRLFARAARGDDGADFADGKRALIDTHFVNRAFEKPLGRAAAPSETEVQRAGVVNRGREGRRLLQLPVHVEPDGGPIPRAGDMMELAVEHVDDGTRTHKVDAASPTGSQEEAQPPAGGIALHRPAGGIRPTVRLLNHAILRIRLVLVAAHPELDGEAVGRDIQRLGVGYNDALVHPIERKARPGDSVAEARAVLERAMVITEHVAGIVLRPPPSHLPGRRRRRCAGLAKPCAAGGVEGGDFLRRQRALEEGDFIHIRAAVITALGVFADDRRRGGNRDDLRPVGDPGRLAVNVKANIVTGRIPVERHRDMMELPVIRHDPGAVRSLSGG
ncbi:MAG: hypothetical protein BWX84_01924 [Verrucomicrobia bacterium ADurb.Bin118]|nr:MAG: hypothetical protein BWX84_01924 [Verrucomicrobia bacterium ADurb.Bin118]